MNDVLPRAIYAANYEYHQLVARNETNSTSSNGAHKEEKPPSYKVIGLVLAITSGLFIGVSFVLKKYGLLKANLKYNEEAGEGYGYLKNFWWWSGMTLMILGEICNFAAYLFADAILVTPLGALSVVICAILSSIFLKERLSFVGKMGCFNCIVGAVVIAVNAPEQAAVSTIQEFKKMFLSPGFLVFGGVIIVGCAIVAIWVAPKYGKKSMMVYLTICSLIGGLSVVSIQGIGAAVTAQARGIPQFNQWFLYIVLVFVVSTLVTEIIYLNKALNLYNAALVTPTYYVYFTSATIVSSAVLYKGFKGGALSIVTVVLGFLQICAGVILLQLSKSAKDVPDTAVFSGDLDQVRTVAEQEEPEYEPRADTMRGTAALLRAVSTRRQQRETKDVVKIKEEHMAPIGENEQVQWDGIRRRRTLSSPGSPPARRKSVHPPLGYAAGTSIPEDDDDNDTDNGMHPGFWSHLPFKRKHGSQRGSSRHSATTADGSTAAVPMGPVGRPHRGTIGSVDGQTMHSIEPGTPPQSSNSVHHFGLPSTLRRVEEHPSTGTGTTLQPAFSDDDNTAYHGPGSQHIQWSASVSEPQLARNNHHPDSPGPSPPPHSSTHLPRTPIEGGTRRQFSFQNMFARGRSRDGTSAPSPVSDRPGMNRSALSFNRKGSSTGRPGVADATEEERLGLVRGDTRAAESDSPPGYDSQHNSPDESPDRQAAYDSGTVRRKEIPKSSDTPPSGSEKGGKGPSGATGGSTPAGESTQGRAFL